MNRKDIIKHKEYITLVDGSCVELSHDKELSVGSITLCDRNASKYEGNVSSEMRGEDIDKLIAGLRRVKKSIVRRRTIR